MHFALHDNTVDLSDASRVVSLSLSLSLLSGARGVMVQFFVDV